MIRTALRLLAVTAVGLASWTAPAPAALLVDPTGGTAIAYTDIDDGIATRSLEGTFNFFGTALTSIGVGVNGTLNTINSTAFNDSPLAGLPSSINPFYDDLYLFDGATVSDKLVAGSYYAATWDGVYNRGYLTAGASDTFQAILFEADTMLDGFQFRSGDIAFSYGPMLQAFNRGTATVGLSNSDGSITAPLPGTTDGQISDTSLLPTGSKFLLFRSTAGGTYNASIESTEPSAVPEPASWALLGTGLLLAARLRPRPARRAGA